jgi:hypothetical protein
MLNRSLKVDVYEKFTRNETFLEYGESHGLVVKAEES